MKVKVSILTITFLLIGAMTVGALVYHINDASEALKAEYAEEIAAYKSEKDFKIKNDVSDLTQKEIERMRLETEQYLQEKMGSDYNRSLNDKTNEIIEATNEKIEEIKQYIDDLISAE